MATHRVLFPFVRIEYDGPKDGEYVTDAKSWKPGTRAVLENEYSDEDWVADGMGYMLLEVITTCKPGKYPERTFYVRQFEDPDGRIFGKTKLRVTPSHTFRALLKGYRHQFDIAGQP